MRKNISHEIERFEIKSDILMDGIEIKIKGKICDETDSPLDNASVSFSIGGTTIDLVSDKDGSFSFTVGQQFLNQTIGYEVNKKGFKIKSGKLKLLENLKCINLSKTILPSWIKIAVVGIVLIGAAIFLFLLPFGPELSIDFNLEPDTQAQTLSIWNSGFSIWNFGSEILEWRVYSDKDWMVVSPESGTDSGTVNVSVNCDDMNPGSYTGNIIVHSNGGTMIVSKSLDIRYVDGEPYFSNGFTSKRMVKIDDPLVIELIENSTISIHKINWSTQAVLKPP